MNDNLVEKKIDLVNDNNVKVNNLIKNDVNLRTDYNYVFVL